MASEEEKLVQTLETRVRQLILQYKDLKTENEALYEMVDERDAQIKLLKQETENLKASYANLKLAKMIEIGDNDMKDARSRLSKLVRDVDRCIALLKA